MDLAMLCPDPVVTIRERTQTMEIISPAKVAVEKSKVMQVKQKPIRKSR